MTAQENILAELKALNMSHQHSLSLQLAGSRDANDAAVKLESRLTRIEAVIATMAHHRADIEAIEARLLASHNDYVRRFEAIETRLAWYAGGIAVLVVLLGIFKVLLKFPL